MDETHSVAPSLGSAPPYLPFRLLTELLARLEVEGIPARLDRPYLANISAGAVAPLLTGLRALELIDTDGRPLPTLVQLATSAADRPQHMATLIRVRYPWAVELSAAGATQQELEAAFQAHGPSGSTLRKSVAFFLSAARYAGIPLSREFKGSVRASAGRSRESSRNRFVARRHDARRAVQRPPSGGGELATMRMQYFELLRKKAEEWGQPRDDILDRIERLIGVLEREVGHGDGPADYSPRTESENDQPRIASRSLVQSPGDSNVGGAASAERSIADTVPTE